MKSVARREPAGAMVREDPADVPPIHALDWNFYRFIQAASGDPEFEARIRDIAARPKTKVFHRTVLVRGFGWDATAQTLLETFRPYGPIEDCRVAAAAPAGVAADAPWGGVGLVIFTTRAATVASLKQPSKLINNRPTHSQLMFPGRAFFSMTHPDYTPVYLTNISPGTTPSALYDLLTTLPGEIVKRPFFLDIPAASAFIIYKTPQDADAAIRSSKNMLLRCSASPRALVQEGTKLLLPRVNALRETDGSRGFAGGFEIFLKDINGPVDDHILLPFFAQFGEILAGPFRYHIDTPPPNEPWELTLFIYKSRREAKTALREPYKTFLGNRFYCSASLQDQVSANLMLYVNISLDSVVADQELLARNAPISPMPSTALLSGLLVREGNLNMSNN